MLYPGRSQTFPLRCIIFVDTAKSLDNIVVYSLFKKAVNIFLFRALSEETKRDLDCKSNCLQKGEELTLARPAIENFQNLNNPSGIDLISPTKQWHHFSELQFLQHDSQLSPSFDRESSYKAKRGALSTQMCLRTDSLRNQSDRSAKRCKDM